MKSNQHILKVFAVVLLLTFSQKLGAGLYLHNWFHFKNCQQSAHSPAANVGSYSCNCVDDFSMPFADPVCENGYVASIPEQCFVSILIQPVPIKVRVFRSLRGPPVFLS
jgi:hypothetical protein